VTSAAWRRQCAGDFSLSFVAAFTGHLAAPLKPAVARCDNLDLLPVNVKTTVSAKSRTSSQVSSGVSAVWICFAGSPNDSLVTSCDVHPAVIGRALEENQFPFLHLLLLSPGHSLRARRPVNSVAEEVFWPVKSPSIVVDPKRSLVLAFQIFSHLRKIWELSPAGLRRTGAGNPVALAQSSQGFPHSNSSSLVVVQVCEGFWGVAEFPAVQKLP